MHEYNKQSKINSRLVYFKLISNHTSDAHIPSQESTSLIKFGKCLVKTCVCKQFVEPIEEIDDELI